MSSAVGRLHETLAIDIRHLTKRYKKGDRPLTALTLSGVGAALGILAPSQQLVGLISQVTLIFVLFVAPVLIPIEHLPLPLQVFGMLLPPTYAADALRRAMAGIADARMALDLAVLTVFTAISLLGVTRGLRWRLR